MASKRKAPRTGLGRGESEGLGGWGSALSKSSTSVTVLSSFAECPNSAYLKMPLAMVRSEYRGFDRASVENTSKTRLYIESYIDDPSKG